MMQESGVSGSAQMTPSMQSSGVLRNIEALQFMTVPQRLHDGQHKLPVEYIDRNHFQLRNGLIVNLVSTSTSEDGAADHATAEYELVQAATTIVDDGQQQQQPQYISILNEDRDAFNGGLHQQQQQPLEQQQYIIETRNKNQLVTSVTHHPPPMPKLMPISRKQQNSTAINANGNMFYVPSSQSELIVNEPTILVNDNDSDEGGDDDEVEGVSLSLRSRGRPRKSLPHKKRIEIESLPSQQRPKISDDAGNKYKCELCTIQSFSQFDFYRHLKGHYEPEPEKIPEETIQIDEELREYANDVCADDSDVYDETYLLNDDDDELPKYSAASSSIEVMQKYDDDNEPATITNEFSDGEDMLDDGIRSVVNNVQLAVDNDLENLNLRTTESTMKLTKKRKSSARSSTKSKRRSTKKVSRKKLPIESDATEDEDEQENDAAATEPPPPPTSPKKQRIQRPRTIASTMKEWELEIHSDTDSKLRGGKKSSKKQKSYKCKLCLKVCHSKNSLHYHFLSHTGERPYTCNECGKDFFAASALKVHMRLHSGEKPFSCDFCGRDFRQWGDLKYHIASLHAENKNHQCEFCGKEFARRYSLVIHRRIHTGERNYECEHCGKSFRASSYLQDHRRIHTGEKPHACEHCGKCFRIRSDLKRHWNIHLRDGSATTAAVAINSSGSGKTKLVSKKAVASSSSSATNKVQIETAQSIVVVQDSGDEPMNIKIETPTLNDEPVSYVVTRNY